MKRPLYMAVCAILLLGAAPARADDNAGFSFDPASVRFGYADGYWDHEHRWHAWPSAKEARDFHRRFQDRIYGYRHTRYPNDGWREGLTVRGSGSEKRASSDKEPNSQN